MDENRISGTAKNAAGKIEEGVGNLVGDFQNPKFKVSSTRQVGLRRTYTGKQRMPLARLPPASTSGFAQPSKRSLASK